MIPFLVIAVVMLAIACAWVLVPLLSRRRVATIDGEASNLAVLRDQRAELEADLANGVLSSEQYDTARVELDRRVLEETAGDAVSAPGTSRASAWTAALVGAGFPIAAVVLYLVLGTPVALLPDLSQVAGADGQKGASSQDIEAMIERVKERLATNPDDLEGWKVLARTYYVLGRAKEAAGAYERATALAPDDADLLADYADAIAITQGPLVRRRARGDRRARAARESEPVEGERAGGHARIPARQLRQGGRALGAREGGRAGGFAGGTIDRIQPLRSARARARGAKVGASATGAKVAGMVTLSPALAGAVAPDDTVFVFARPADGSRMPLALLRVKGSDLPLAFTLDDSTAMMPNRKLSDHSEVIVGARISKSGNATPQSGDLEGTSSPVKLGTTGVKLVIDRRLP